MNLYKHALGRVVPIDTKAVTSALERQLTLTKPPGSLGDLEEVANRLCGISAKCPAPIPDNPHICVFAGDHGVHQEKVTPWPQEVTAQMVANFLAGGAAVNVIARQVGARVSVVDVGVKAELDPAPGLIISKVKAGTRNLKVESAMSNFEARESLDRGVEVAETLHEAGYNLFVTGDMGIANTTPSAAIISYLSGIDPEVVTGRGTGVDDATLAIKIQVIRDAISRVNAIGNLKDNPIELLAQLGGLEIGAICGFIISAASLKVPVIVDGVISLAGALLADAISPIVSQYVFAGHLSVEPGARIALDMLQKKPLLSLDMRLGEGSGGALAIPILQSAARLLAEMASFEEAGVEEA